MLKKTLISLLILASVLVLPIVAQTPPAPAANQTMGTNPAATTTTVTKKTTTTTKTVHRKTMRAVHHGGAYDDASRLAALLADTQGKAMLSPASWKAIANEGNALANKLYAATSGKNRTAAKEARTHVRLMHAAAMKGDADGAKSHAAMALPYVYKIIEATAPKK
jgi:hypothetical protein